MRSFASEFLSQRDSPGSHKPATEGTGRIYSSREASDVFDKTQPGWAVLIAYAGDLHSGRVDRKGVTNTPSAKEPHSGDEANLFRQSEFADRGIGERRCLIPRSKRLSICGGSKEGKTDTLEG